MNKYFLLAITAFVFSCKKDDVVIDPVEYNIERNFLCEVTQEYSYSSSVSNDQATTVYDIVLSTKIQNDSLIFRGLKFPLSSFNSETGSGSHTLVFSSTSQVTLTLSNKFEDIQLSQSQSSPNSPNTESSISGTECNIIATSETNNSFDAQAGNYDLNVHFIESFNNTDTNYSAIYPVSYSSMNERIVIDGISREMALFHSHYNRESTSSNGVGSYDYYQNDYSWENGDLNYYHRSGIVNTFTSSDSTIYLYHYQGVKQ